jgi:TolB-like protein
VADLFLSYKSQDRARVRPLVQALQADGLTVWWDAEIEGGSGWRQSIQTELDAAKCVLVAWTKRSAGPEGEFVHDEATRAKRRGAYLPVRLDAVDLPLGFGETQALPLIGWKGDTKDPRYQAVLAAARAVVAGSALPKLRDAAPAPALNRRALIGGGAALGAVALGGGWYLWRQGAGAATQSIAVMPFANLSGDPEQAYFSDGIAEELRSALSRIAGLKVAARTSSEKLRDADVKDAADQLGVADVLTGSVRKAGGTVRVSAQLLDGETGLEKWSQAFDRPEGNALELQTGISENVANALSLKLGKAAAMLGGTKDAVAYDAYLRGLAMRPTDEAGFRAKLAAFEAAIAADPGFAAAHANKALQLTNLARDQSGEEVRRTLALAEAAAWRAIALAPELPIGHHALGVLQEARLDLRGADASYAKVLALPGVGAQELAGIGQTQIAFGRTAAGLALVERAVALDPLNRAMLGQQIYALTLAGHYKEALAAIKAFDDVYPDDKADPYDKGLARLWTGDARGALAAFGEAEDWVKTWGQALAYTRLGDRAGSDRTLAALKAMDGGTLAYQLAGVHALRGEPDLALAQLERAVAARDPGLVDLRIDPVFESLRKDPRFAAIEKRLGFPAA